MRIMKSFSLIPISASVFDSSFSCFPLCTSLMVSFSLDFSAAILLFNSATFFSFQTNTLSLTKQIIINGHLSSLQCPFLWDWLQRIQFPSVSWRWSSWCMYVSIYCWINCFVVFFDYFFSWYYNFFSLSHEVYFSFGSLILSISAHQKDRFYS